MLQHIFCLVLDFEITTHVNKHDKQEININYTHKRDILNQAHFT